jgi:hypothetical protein
MKNRIQSKGQVKITSAKYREMIFGKLNPKQPGPRFRSEWEREFGEWLTASRYEWKYEEIRLKLADRTTYTPDFWVPEWTGPIEKFYHPTGYKEWPGYYGAFFEVKGFRRQAGMIKFKVAKEQYPEFKFYLVTKNKLGGWVIE